MCNGINKSNGKQCGRKAEWCSQHISQKPAEPIAEPVAEQKNEEPELIQAEKEIVETIIVPPTSMSPNATSITATVPELPIVEAEKSEPVENNSTDRIHPRSIYKYQDANDTNEAVDAIWRDQARFKLAKRNGAPGTIIDADEYQRVLEMGRSVFLIKFFSQSEEEVENTLAANGEEVLPEDNMLIAFNSEDDYKSYINSVKDIMSSTCTNIDYITKAKDYDEHLYDLCKLISPNWFKDRDNMWNFTRMVYQTPGDKMLHRRTYAAILADKFGEHFNELLTMSQNDTEGPITKYPVKVSLSSLKSIAGGSDAEGYKAWRLKYDPEPIKVKKVKKTSDDSETGSESNDEVESRLGGRWVAEAKKICEKTSISYDKLIAGMLKDIEVNGDYCMMDWRDEFIQPINRIVQDAEVPLADFIALAGNWVYKSAEEAAKFAAQIIDPTIVLFANGDVFVRQTLDECEDDGAKRTPSALMKLINFRFFAKDMNGEEVIRSRTLDKLMLTTPVFAFLNRMLCSQ
jgi:hypothetical protein